MNWLLQGGEAGHTVHWAHSDQYFYSFPPNLSSRNFQLSECTWLTLSYRTRLTEGSENYSRGQVSELFVWHHEDTSYLLHRSQTALLNFHSGICLLKKKKKDTAYTYQRHHFQCFHRHLCTMVSQRARPRNASFQGENLPGDFPFWGLCLALPLPLACYDWRHEGQTNVRKTESVALSPCWEGQEPYSFIRRTLLVSSRFLPVLWRVQAKNISRRGHGVNFNQ